MSLGPETAGSSSCTSTAVMPPPLVDAELAIRHLGDGGGVAEQHQVTALDDLDVEIAAGGGQVRIAREVAVRPLAGEVGERPAK